MHFHEWKVLYFDKNFTEVCSQWSNWQYPSIGLENGLVPNRRQAIIWTNADPIQWRIYAAMGGDELKKSSKGVLCHYMYFGEKLYIFGIVAHADCSTSIEKLQGSLLLKWLNFNPSLDK